MSLRNVLIATLFFAGASAPAFADRLLIERVQAADAASLPARGQTMAQVEAKFGAPKEKLAPRGGQSAAWPAIHRWVYQDFTVYFEQSRVINAVVNRAASTETGPAPVPARAQ